MWCSVTFKAANLILSPIVSASVFLFFFLFYFFLGATGVLSVLHGGGLVMQWLRMTQKSTHSVAVCVRACEGWSVSNPKYTRVCEHVCVCMCVCVYIHMYSYMYIHIHVHTQTLTFRGNTSIPASPSSKVGLFLPHLVVTWLLSANQGFFLNKPLPQDMFLKVFCFVLFLLQTAATLVYSNWSSLQKLFPDSFKPGLRWRLSTILLLFFVLMETWVITRKKRREII